MEIRDLWYEIQELQEVDPVPERIRVSIEQTVKKALTKAREEEAKAFGGCRNCYGKGYSTVIENEISHADFIGDKTSVRELPPMRFCKCDRGEQLKKLIAKE